MDRRRGIAYCGLACALCGGDGECAGCRNDGCTGKETCKNLQCCRAKGLLGCWECDEFPCGGTILDKMRIRAFAEFAGQWGVETLLDCLERNEAAGLLYHYPGMLVGDYDLPSTSEGMAAMILSGTKPASPDQPHADE